MYVFGGRDANSVVLNSVEVPEQGIARQPMPHAVNRAAAAAVGDRIYVVGGNDGTQDLAVLQEYDVGTDTWRVRQAMPQRRSGHAAFAFNGKLIVIGGVDGSTSLSSVEVYDPSTTGEVPSLGCSMP